MSEPEIAIVLAAGEGTRWNNYRNTPKHLLEIDGQPILHRTVELLQNHLDDVWVVAQHDPRYWGSWRTLSVTPRETDADKFYSSHDLWNDERHVLFVYGDCYFTEDAIATMTQPTDEWRLFCRPEGSELTGKKWGECFGFSIPAADIPTFKSTIEWLAGVHALGKVWRCGGWELYRALNQHADLNEHVMTDHYVVIDDLTEDFDYGDDYEAWNERRPC
jgi:hypothetical protein